MCKLVIVRGLPGSGKTTYAEKLAQKIDALHIEADQFHENCGEYEWHKDQLDMAHKWCFGTAMYNLRQGTSVVVANTFVEKWTIKPYVEGAITLCVPEIEIVSVETDFGSIHDVPVETLKSMCDRYVDNIDLCFPYDEVKYEEIRD